MLAVTVVCKGTGFTEQLECDGVCQGTVVLCHSLSKSHPPVLDSCLAICQFANCAAA